MTVQNPLSIRSSTVVMLTGLALAFIFAFFPVIRDLVTIWLSSDDNSHGLLIVPISLYLMWRNREAIKASQIVPGRFGWVLPVIAILFYLFAYMAGIATLGFLSMVFTIWVIVWTLLGKAIFKIILFPMGVLLLMIPVPSQFYSMATVPLQLLVSQISTVIVSALDIPILREGNLLHLSDRTLAVVQACSGLRSLMSLFAVCAVFGYLSLSSNLLRMILILTSIPVAVIVNIVRVVLMILVFHFMEIDLSQGTPHTVFGMMIFFLALLIIVITRELLSKWDSKPVVD